MTPGMIDPEFPENCESIMSASPFFSAAATSRPFIFSPPPSPICSEEFAEEPPKKPVAKADQILATVGAASRLAAVVPASRLDVRPAPAMASSGIPQLDSLTGGWARGCLSEICGAASSGRTSILFSALAQATHRGEVCALVDASDAFHPASAAAAGVEMSRLLWVRCGEKTRSQKHRMPAASYSHSYQKNISSGIQKAIKGGHGFSRWESQLGQFLKVTDLLLQSNGFGMIVLDLGDVPAESARRIPMASWFRFRRAVEHTPIALLVLEQQPIAGSCSSVILKVCAKRPKAVENRIARAELSHTELLDQFAITAQLLCSRLERKSERKPMQSTASFKSRAAWAG
jgi:recA bacterial DNA recombination protein